MKGNITFRILEAVSSTALGAVDLFDVFLSAGYGVSQGKLLREFSKRESGHTSALLEKEEWFRARARYHNMLSRLRRDGLIRETKKEGRKYVSSTGEGIRKFLVLRKHMKNALPDNTYKGEAGSNAVIVVFDIPEKEHRKRRWLRGALKNLDLTMLQKSVWFGKTKIPKQFIDDLDRMKISTFVEIFEVTKTGSIEALRTSV